MAKSYVIHYLNGDTSDGHEMIYMGYSETKTWTLTEATHGQPMTGKWTLAVQAFDVVGQGANDIEKAAYLNEHALGSAWSNPYTKITVSA